jgi:hypothetical protein
MLESVVCRSLEDAINLRNAISMVSKPLCSSVPNHNLHIDSTHLLSNHNDTRSLRGTADARDRKQLDEAREEVVGLCESGVFDHALFLIELRLDIVDVSRCLQRRVAKPQQRLVRVVRLLFLEIPAWRLGAKVDADDCAGER